MDRLTKLLARLDVRGGLGLEVGALCWPTLRRPEANVLYADYADTATLRKNYASVPNVAVDEIVSVDIVWRDEDLDRLVDGRRFDHVVASHVCEHVPDLLWWLSELRSVLKPYGSVRLVVPDKRYTFDRGRQSSTIADVLAAYFDRRRRPGSRDILDFWVGFSSHGYSSVSNIRAALARARESIDRGSHHDVHCWVFTPESFVSIMSSLAELDMLGFACTEIHGTAQHELDFFVHLMKSDDRNQILESWRWAAWEITQPVMTDTEIGTAPQVNPKSALMRKAVALPDTACRSALYLDNPDGRDQVAYAVQADWAAFECPLPAILHAWARRNPGLAIDVGANTGYYALLAALSARENCVLAFEPDRVVLARLETNIRLNELERRVFAHATALSDYTGLATLYVPSQEHGVIDTSSSLEPTFANAHSELRQVDVTTLDGFLRQTDYSSAAVTLLKIDVEGHEAAVLRGAIETIRRWRPAIFIEILPRAEMDFLSRLCGDLEYLDFPLAIDHPPPHRLSWWPFTPMPGTMHSCLPRSWRCSSS